MSEKLRNTPPPHRPPPLTSAASFLLFESCGHHLSSLAFSCRAFNYFSQPPTPSPIPHLHPPLLYVVISRLKNKLNFNVSQRGIWPGLCLRVWLCMTEEAGEFPSVCMWWCHFSLTIFTFNECVCLRKYTVQNWPDNSFNFKLLCLLNYEGSLIIFYSVVIQIGFFSLKKWLN